MIITIALGIVLAVVILACAEQLLKAALILIGITVLALVVLLCCLYPMQILFGAVTIAIFGGIPAWVIAKWG